MRACTEEGDRRYNLLFVTVIFALHNTFTTLISIPSSPPLFLVQFITFKIISLAHQQNDHLGSHLQCGQQSRLYFIGSCFSFFHHVDSDLVFRLLPQVDISWRFNCVCESKPDSVQYHAILDGAAIRLDLGCGTGWCRQADLPSARVHWPRRRKRLWPHKDRFKNELGP